MEHVKVDLSSWHPAKCAVCGVEFSTTRDVDTCPPCAAERARAGRVNDEWATMSNRLEPLCTSWLVRAGLSPRETEAEWGRVPEWLRGRVDGLGGLTDEAPPRRGFGFSGEAGRGKTYTLAAYMRLAVLRRWTALGPRLGMRAMDRWLRWVRWPEHANRMKVRSTVDGGLAEVAGLEDDLGRAPALVLDDLGAERAREYDADWTSSRLDQLVDRRYQMRLPTWYTTNLTAEELLARYGSRLYSRLVSDNPMLAIPAGPDLRMRGAS